MYFPNENLYERMKEDLTELLFITKFLQNKKEFKKERKVLKQMVKDFSNDNYEKYINEKDNDL